MGTMQFGPPGPFYRFQHGYEPDQHFLAWNQCWKVMLTMQSQNFDPKVHFCPQNQHPVPAPIDGALKKEPLSFNGRKNQV